MFAYPGAALVCCSQTEVLDHSSCAGAQELSENCPVVPTEQWLCLQLPLINKAKAACSAVWAPSSPSCFHKQDGQPHQAVCALWAASSFDILLFFNKQLFPVAHAGARITTLGATVPVLGRTLPGMCIFLWQQQIVSCTW